MSITDPKHRSAARALAVAYGNLEHRRGRARQLFDDYANIPLDLIEDIGVWAGQLNIAQIDAGIDLVDPESLAGAVSAGIQAGKKREETR